MAEFDEWNQKGATLSDATALKEYGVSLDFIEEGIRAGKLEYRQGAIYGNPYVRVLRNQLEKYIVEKLGSSPLANKKNETELRRVKKEIAELKKKLTALQARKAKLEQLIGIQNTTSANSFTPAAKRLWDGIPPKAQELLLNNVWCVQCRTMVLMSDFIGDVQCGDLRLQGICSVCGHKVVRIIETSEAPI